MQKSLKFSLIGLFGIALLGPSQVVGQSGRLEKAAADVEAATAKYRNALERVLAIYERELARRNELTELRQDLLETRFLSKGRRVDLIQLWHWFDDQMTGVEPMLIDGEEQFLNVQDKDLQKVRQRIAEIQAFLPTLRGDDLEAFKRVKYKLRRTVMRLTYDLHHLFKRLEKYRKNFGGAVAPRPERVPLEAVAEIPEPQPVDEHDEE